MKKELTNIKGAYWNRNVGDVIVIQNAIGQPGLEVVLQTSFHQVDNHPGYYAAFARPMGSDYFTEVGFYENEDHARVRDLMLNQMDEFQIKTYEKRFKVPCSHYC